jgi:hypothetical protein
VPGCKLKMFTEAVVRNDVRTAPAPGVLATVAAMPGRLLTTT